MAGSLGVNALSGLASLHSCVCAICNLSLLLFPSLFWAIQNVMLLYFSGMMSKTERVGVLTTDTVKLPVSYWA